jgi:hypothetical protein
MRWVALNGGDADTVVRQASPPYRPVQEVQVLSIVCSAVFSVDWALRPQ